MKSTTTVQREIMEVPEAGAHDSTLIVVSNRQPYEHCRRDGEVICRPTDGGLSSALDPILRRFGGVWIAWGSGEADQEIGRNGQVIPVPEDQPSYGLRRVWLTAEEVKGGYLGYANEVLWPLCHVTLDRIAYQRAFWAPYRSLNRRFAAAVLAEIRRRPRPVWVHDFHLSLVPKLIKEASPATPVFVFWHVPWPGSDVFRILPERVDILRGLLAADSVVFQTPAYAQAFVDCAQRFLQADVNCERRIVTIGSHRTTVVARAISIDFQSFDARARTVEVQGKMAALGSQIPGRQSGPDHDRALQHAPQLRVGIGVDRLDYTKGLLKRMWALDRFFTRYPEYRGVFTFVQIAVPTRSELDAYRRYRKLIWQTVFEINQRHCRMDEEKDHNGAEPRGDSVHVHGICGWRPIHYLEGSIDFDTLLAYYRLADLALVSSVNDGMNLVAKEYVASQVDETGVLLVSQMAGSAEELTDALIINPYDPDGLADSIRQALEMPEVQRRDRMRAMRAYLKTHDLYAWAEGCLWDAGISVETRKLLP
jgi:trehalose 6-phosphate synthase/phosphatase